MQPPDEAGDEATPLPAWAKELLKRPLVEVRLGFSIGYDAPSEDSSTIVLTAPSGKYVDLRFSTLPRSDSVLTVKNPGKIWGYATAGLSTAVIQPGKGDCPPYGCTVHATWEHPIDSSGGFDTDGADLLLLADGARMEVGCMVIHGKMQMFKEYWVTPAGGRTEKPCVVVELEDGPGEDGKGAQGMAIRIGDYCQGILQHGDEFWFERWEFQGDRHEWTKDTRSNTPTSETGFLPCWWMTDGARALGETIVANGRKWQVTESVADTSKL